MPGILGLVLPNESRAIAPLLQRMLGRMWHEPFYEQNSYVDENMAAGAAIVNLVRTGADEQPAWNSAKDVCLFFSGECFPTWAQRFNGDKEPATPAHELLRLYREQGLSFLRELNGIFSGALFDLKQKRLFLFNDRYGLGRIYYHQTSTGFYFASEAKALLAILPKTRELDAQSLAEQFSVGCTMQDRSLFKGISLLPPASIYELTSKAQPKKKRYFLPNEWETQPLLDEETYYQSLKACFSRILPRYLEAEEPLAMSLTGGLDGRMIMAYAADDASFPCYTFGGSYRDCADVTLARRSAAIHRHPHRVLPVGDEFLKQFPDLAARSIAISDGTMDVTGAVELYVNRLAREVAPIRLTGNYGSEILRRNVAFRPTRSPLPFLEGSFARLLETVAETYKEEAACAPLSFIAFKQVPWHHHSRLSVEQSQLTVRSPYLDNELVKLAYQAPPHQAKSTLPALRLVAERDAQLGRIPTDRGLLFSPRPILTKLAHRWQELTVRAEYAYDYGMPGWLARLDHRLAPLKLERHFLGRHKFYHFRVWYRDQLAPFVRDILLDPRSLARDYISPSAVRRIVEEHTSGRANHTLAIHRLLTIELTQRELIESYNTERTTPNMFLSCA